MAAYEGGSPSSKDESVMAVARRVAARRLAGADLAPGARARLVEEMAAASVVGARRAAETRPRGADPAPFYAAPPLRARLRALVPADAVAALRAGRAVVVDGFLPPRAVADVRASILALPLEPNLQSTLGARGDAIYFLDEAAPGAAGYAVRLLKAAAGRVNEAAGRVVVHAPKNAMAAVYPGGGAAYARHRDNSGDPDNGRAVTAILYANGSDWDVDRDGGALVVAEAGGGDRAVAPVGGRVVLFRSDLEHEVRPAFAARAALTLWLLKPS